MHPPLAWLVLNLPRYCTKIATVWIIGRNIVTPRGRKLLLVDGCHILQYSVSQQWIVGRVWPAAAFPSGLHSSKYVGLDPPSLLAGRVGSWRMFCVPCSVFVFVFCILSRGRLEHAYRIYARRPPLSLA
jgi:hypothetical protein